MPARPTQFARLLELAAGDERLQLLAETAHASRLIGDLDRADRIYRGLELLAPNDPTAAIGLAEVSLAAGRPTDAEQHARRALHTWNCTRPAAALAASVRGQALSALGRTAEAVRCCEIVRELDPDGLGATIE